MNPTEISVVRRHPSGGFSMIELSIVMIIIGLIIAGGIGIYEPSMRQALKNKNETVVRQAVETLIGFAGTHRSLPAGLMDSGVVHSVLDAQMNPLQYAFDASLTAVDTLCTQDDARLSVAVLKPDGTTRFSIPDVALVIWSRGYDGATQPEKTTGAIDTPRSYPVPLYAEGSADDLVGWATMAELKAAAGCGAGSLSILASGLPAGSVGMRYDPVTFTAEGGKKPYSWCVAFPDQTRAAKMSFAVDNTNPLPPENAFDGCQEPTMAGDALTLTGILPFVSTDQGGPYDFVIHLRDSNPRAHTVTRRFSLYVTP
ncbi:MAG: prepilin-type N-terminal cleavage/methylation domain-containing protein [Magnetococcales bacterium]|nr:prepilin-type N-terminal cleavage/methylation domain-containing protein [Magnetococcales bacterium]